MIPPETYYHRTSRQKKSTLQYISNVNASSYKTNKGENYGLMIILCLRRSKTRKDQAG